MIKESSRNFKIYIALIVTVAVGARLLLSAYSYGTNDAANWERFSRAESLCFLYSHDPFFNNPPLAGYWGKAAGSIAKVSGISFPFIFRLPGIMLEGAIALLLCLFARAWAGDSRWNYGLIAGLLYAVSPDSILVSSYHGNTDALCIFFSLAAVLLLESGTLPIVAGAALAIAASIKIIPVLLLLPLLAAIRGARRRVLFLAGFSTAALPYILIAGCGEAVWKKIFQYGSLPELWGFAALLNLLRILIPELSGVAEQLIVSFRADGRWILIGAILLLSIMAAKYRGPSFPAIGAAVFTLFLLLAPGFGVQYTAYPIPFLCALAPLYACGYCFASGIFILMVYLHFGFGTSIPLGSFHTEMIPSSIAELGLPAWGILLLAFPTILKRVYPATAVMKQPTA